MPLKPYLDNSVSMTTQKNTTILVTMKTLIQQLVEMGSLRIFNKYLEDPELIWLLWKLHSLHFEMEIPVASTLVAAITLYAWRIY